MSQLKLALFDVDGVLLDSLTPHLEICEDKNKEYGLGLQIPTATEFKRMVRNGIRISPMKFFFMAVGFPEPAAEKANAQYQEVFMKKYAPAPFPEIHSILSKLHQSLQLGIVTSNVRQNVFGALGKSMQFFNSECIYTKDEKGLSKNEAIASALKRLQLNPKEAIYVGDQPADWEAAKQIGVNFLGVAYGWGISEEDTEFPVAKCPLDVPGYILSWDAHSNLKEQRSKGGPLNPTLV